MRLMMMFLSSKKVFLSCVIFSALGAVGQGLVGQGMAAIAQPVDSAPTSGQIMEQSPDQVIESATTISQTTVQTPVSISEQQWLNPIRSAATSSEGAVPSPLSNRSYVLGAGDQIFINVFGYEEFTGTWIVLPDGTITLPLLGSIVVTGQTPDALSQYLTQRLNEHLVDPVVTVAPSVLRPVIVNVAGEVHRPGPLQLRSLSAVNPTVTVNTVSSRAESSLEAVPTLSSALVEAGGITLDADIRSVVVTRRRPGQEPESTTINLWNSIWSDDMPEDLILQDGDAIFVPTLENDTDINRRLLVQSNYAPESIVVRVMGEVKRPGEVNVSPTSSISGAIASAGGHTTDGRLRHVALVRLNEDGSIFQEELDLRDLNDEGQIQQGDVIYVPQQNSSGILDFGARLLSPINTILGFLRLLQ